MIYVKTESGQSALLGRSLALTPRQRSAFIMFDGKRSMQDVLKATEGLGITQDDVVHMVTRGLLVPISTANKVAAMAILPGNPVIAASPAPWSLRLNQTARMRKRIIQRPTR